ncbi:hypothetical protein GVY41_13495 [Frigidibacter albus]|uniref:Uncharacterized protein n=1 Tax=Frigidibacter albus TaxID=1465486 RepID=A0A6L8VJX6_9RHOB|nr:hypothetical protein [Frigidibacter albus]MZQ90101.1 hypothetical protein [Frigidibacter albus]NBE32009.1 hypothetical protein [Frigidibacter albus]GGH57388.1 hypothetical protein GCM10011341_26740 [Frigidibacter albus]
MNRSLAAKPGTDAAPGAQEDRGAAQQTPETPSRDAASAKIVADAMRDQTLRQDRLRHVQEFLTSPMFIDMREQQVTVSDSPAELAERRRDLDYRIEVLESVLALLIEERDMLDRVVSAQG